MPSRNTCFINCNWSWDLVGSGVVIPHSSVDLGICSLGMLQVQTLNLDLAFRECVGEFGLWLISRFRFAYPAHCLVLQRSCSDRSESRLRYGALERGGRVRLKLSLEET